MSTKLICVAVLAFPFFASVSTRAQGPDVDIYIAGRNLAG